jgi:hypothetical protein
MLLDRGGIILYNKTKHHAGKRVTVEAISRSPISITKNTSHVMASFHADSEKEPGASSIQQDEVIRDPGEYLPQPKHLFSKPLSALKTLLAPSLGKLSLLGFGLLCQFGSIVAQPLSQPNLLAGEASENVKDRIETVIEKPEAVYDSVAGKTIAKNASTVAKKLHTTGYCYRGVKATLGKSGIALTGKFAYLAANQIAQQESFKEISVAAKDLGSLQPGSIVIWGKSKDVPYGHVSIALGDGREASDHIEPQMTRHGRSTFRVFIPVKDAPQARGPALDFLVAREAFVSLQAPSLK